MKPIPFKNPPSRFDSQHLEYFDEPPELYLKLYEDRTSRILSKNDSPDLGFRWSLNPYRGCLHACAYCYARPSHEYLGFGAGADFDRKIVVKPRAAELLRGEFDRGSWKGEPIVFSGNTDCYQPLEASLELTQKCLQVCAEYRNPLHIITKSPLIERDLKLLQELTESASLGVTISIPFWSASNARAVEPYVASPSRRIQTVRRLAEAGIAVSVNVAPIIPGLNEVDIQPILEASANAGARSAHMTLVRLPGNLQQVFVERMRAAFPLRIEKILARTREVRGGKDLNDARFGFRMKGQGQYAEALRDLFDSTAKRFGLQGASGEVAKRVSTFRRPEHSGARRSVTSKAQLKLF